MVPVALSLSRQVNWYGIVMEHFQLTLAWSILTGRGVPDVRVFRDLEWVLCALVSNSLLLWVLQVSL